MADGLVVYAEEDCARAICIVTIGDNGDSLSTRVSSTNSAPRPRKQPFGSATAGYRVDSRIATKPIGAIHVFVAGHSTRGTGIVAAWISRTGRHEALAVSPTVGRCGRKKPPTKLRPKLRRGSKRRTRSRTPRKAILS
jgi:hypothetical protein